MVVVAITMEIIIILTAVAVITKTTMKANNMLF